MEQFVSEMTKLKKEEADVAKGVGILLDKCAQCAVLLFGGNGFTRTGQGEIAKRRSPESSSPSKARLR